jgi:hypothetical protein
MRLPADKGDVYELRYLRRTRRADSKAEHANRYVMQACREKLARLGPDIHIVGGSGNLGMVSLPVREKQ